MNIYQIFCENPRGDNISFIISSKTEIDVVKKFKKELKHTSKSFENEAKKYISDLIKRIKTDLKSERCTHKYNNYSTKEFVIGDYYFSYQMFNDTPEEEFKTKLINEYTKYYYKEGRSLAYNLDNNVFVVKNLTELSTNCKNTTVLDKQFIYCGR